MEWRPTTPSTVRPALATMFFVVVVLAGLTVVVAGFAYEYDALPTEWRPSRSYEDAGGLDGRGRWPESSPSWV